MPKEVYLCFIDHAIAFAKIRHKELLALQSNIDIFLKDIGLIHDLYLHLIVCIRIENDYSKYTKTEIIIQLYSEAHLGELEVLPGFISDSNNLNNIRYAEDKVLISDTETKLQ